MFRSNRSRCNIFKFKQAQLFVCLFACLYVFDLKFLNLVMGTRSMQDQKKQLFFHPVACFDRN